MAPSSLSRINDATAIASSLRDFLDVPTRRRIPRTPRNKSHDGATVASMNAVDWWHDPSDARSQTLAVVYEPFREHGKWPVGSWVRRTLRRAGVDFDSVIEEIPEGYFVSSPYARGFQASEEVRLTVEGISKTPDGATDVQLLIDVIHEIVKIDAEHDAPDPFDPRTGLEVSSTDLLARVPGAPTDGVTARRLYDLLRLDTNLLGSSGSREDGHWTAEITDRAADYAVVECVSDLTRAREAMLQPRRMTAQPSIEPFVFIVMPFVEPWSSAVHTLIEESLTRVSDVRALRWQRADDIAEPGRITEQIIEALIAADVIVADVTGSNPNVMFELGYADAMRKPIVCLNQDVAASPFDIRDWRQVVYDPSLLEPARVRLTSAIVAALPAPRDG